METIKEVLSVLSWLDLAAIGVLVWAVYKHGWPWVQAKFAGVFSFVKQDVAAIESRVRSVELFVEDHAHRVKSIEDLLIAAKIALPAPAPKA